MGGRVTAAEEVEAQQSIPPLAGWPVLPLSSFAPGPGLVGELKDDRLQTRTGMLWAIMQPVGPDTAAGLEARRDALQAAMQTALNKQFVQLSLGRVPIHVFDAPAQAAIVARLGPVVDLHLIAGVMNCKADLKAKPAGTPLQFMVTGCQVRLGAFPPQNSPSAEILLNRVIREHSSWFISTRVVSEAAAALTPLPLAKRKLHFSAQDELVMDCKRRVRDGVATWSEGKKDVIAYLEATNPAYPYSRQGKEFLNDLHKEWQTRNRPPVEAFPEAPAPEWLLTFWQRRLLLPIATTAPERRRIFWVRTKRNAGKGVLAEFLMSPEAHQTEIFDGVHLPYRGAIDATLLCTNVVNFAMRYADKSVDDQPPGLVICDFPFDFEFTCLDSQYFL